MEDLEQLSSEWDTINALVLLINDAGYGNRDKLTLLAAEQCVWLCVREGEREGEKEKWTKTDEKQRGRQV